MIVAIECFFVTIDRCSAMTGINRWSMMIYCSLQVKFERTQPNGRIQRYGASIFGDIIIKVSKPINKEQQVFWGLFLGLDSICQVFLLHREQDFCNFCCKPSKIMFCIEGVSVGEIYNTLLDSNEGDLSPHTSQTIYFSKTRCQIKKPPWEKMSNLNRALSPYR